MRKWNQYHLWGVVAFLFICLSVISTPARAQTSTPPSTFRVIIGLNAPFRPEGELPNLSAVTWQRFNIANRQKLLLDDLRGMNISLNDIKQFQTIPYMALEVDAAGLLALQLDSNVMEIREDRLSRVDTSSANTLIGAPSAWNIGMDGTGYAVAVLDTGVDFTHPGLSSKRLAEACFTTTYAPDSAIAACPNGRDEQIGFGAAMPRLPSELITTCKSDCDHGTHVAGIVAGNSVVGSPSSYTNGVAPGAMIIGVNIFSLITDSDFCGGASVTPCAVSYDSDQVSGLEYVYGLRTTYNIASVNMSLGGGNYTGDCDGSVSGAYLNVVSNLKTAKIAVIAASGNAGYTDKMGSPGCLSNVISVGATNDCDEVAYFSNVSPSLDLFAPGMSITSTLPVNWAPGTANDYGTWQGTSMATPFVAGAWAIMRQAYPNDSVDSILSRLQSNGVSVIDDFRRYDNSTCSGPTGISGGGLTRKRINLNGVLPTPGEISFASSTSTPSEGQALNVNINLDIGVGTINLPSPFTVNLTYGGTATRNSDYTAPNSVTFTRSGGWSPNTLYTNAATIPITILSDDFARGDESETIIISFATPIAGVPVTPTMPTIHTSTITNTNVQVTGAVNFTSATYTSAEYGDTGLSNTIQVPVTFTIAGNTSNITGSITANISYGGSAVQGTDYTVVQNNVVFDGTTFYQGTYTAYVPVTILPRSGNQGNRTFTMTIAEPPHLDAILGSPSLSTITIRETSNVKINENELRYEMMALLQPTHQIDSVLPDFINGTGMNMVVILDDGTVGTISITLPSQNGSNRVVLGSMTVNGQPASSSYVSIINAELPDLIMRGMNNFIANRTGATQRIEITQISDSEITFAYLP